VIDLGTGRAIARGQVIFQKELRGGSRRRTVRKKGSSESAILGVLREEKFVNLREGYRLDLRDTILSVAALRN